MNLSFRVQVCSLHENRKTKNFTVNAIGLFFVNNNCCLLRHTTRFQYFAGALIKAAEKLEQQHEGKALPLEKASLRHLCQSVLGDSAVTFT